MLKALFYVYVLCQVLNSTKKYSQIIRAINYNRELQDFFIIVFCKLKVMFDVLGTLESCTDNAQIAVCGIKPLSKGTHTCEFSAYKYCYI